MILFNYAQRYNIDRQLMVSYMLHYECGTILDNYFSYGDIVSIQTNKLVFAVKQYSAQVIAICYPFKWAASLGVSQKVSLPESNVPP